MLIVIGGIYLASYAPRRPPLTVPICLAVASAVLLAVNVVLLVRTRGLAWDKFFLVGRWTLLSYVVASGLIEFAFVKDHTRGSALVVLTAMLVLFAVNVPLIISFTVARFSPPGVTPPDLDCHPARRRRAMRSSASAGRAPADVPCS